MGRAGRIDRVGQAVMVAAAFALVMFLCAGCRISADKNKGKDVSIETPLGGMQVKSDPAKVLGRIGLPQYPGSAVVNKHDGNGKDDSSADVDMSFGSFHLRVLAMGLQTGDPEARAEDFYRKALAQYSDVIACRHHQPVGSPVKTGLGLTCADDDKSHHGTDIGDDENELQLKAGSRAKQHIVAIKPSDGGTRIELIALDLPTGLHSGDTD